MQSVSRAGAALIGAAAVLSLGGCADRPNPADPGAPAAARVATPPYTSVAVGGETFEFWPYTTNRLSVTSPDDPVNLLLVGEGDPRAVRAALMALDATQTAFGCTWTDAVGDEQASAAAPIGWTGSAIQLACGPYALRPHLRLFDIGEAILVGAHFEVQIPGTDQHQVLSYALAESMVLNDLIQTGLVDLAGITLTEVITTSTQNVRAIIYNELPAALQELVTGTAGDVSADFPVPNGDGKVTVVPLAHYGGAGTGSYQAFTIEYGQWVDKPFCQAPGEFVYVGGPVRVAMTVTIASDGRLERYMRAQGRLSITTPTGLEYGANVTQDQQAWATGTAHWVQTKLHQVLVPGNGADRGGRSWHLRVGTEVPDDFTEIINCGGVQSQ